MVSAKSKSYEDLLLENKLLREKIQQLEGNNTPLASLPEMHVDEFRILLDAAIRLGSTLDINNLMQEATDKVSQLLNIDTAAIYLLEDKFLYMGAMTPRLGDDFPAEFRWARLEHHLHIKNAVTSRKVIYVPDSNIEEFTAQEQQIIDNHTLRSIWYVPIFTVEENFGVFIIASLNDIKTCSDKQIELIRALANLVALSIQHSLMHKKIEKKNEELSTTLHSIGDGVLSTDLEGNIVLMNPVAERLCGYSLSEAKGQPVTDIFKIFNPKDGELLVNPVSKVLKEGKKINLANNTILRSKNGDEFQIADSASPIINKGGEITGVVLVFSDVTQDYRLRQALKKSEERLLKAEMIGGFGHWEIDIVKNSVTASPGATSVYGLEGDEFNLQNIQAMPLPEYRELLDKALSDLIQYNIPYEVEYSVKRPDGEITTVHSHAVYDKDKKKVFGILIDVTQRVKAEAALKESEERYRDFFMKDLTGDFLSTIDGKVIDCNPAFLNTLGYESLEEVQELNTVRFYENAEERDKLLTLLMECGEVKNYELKLLNSAGRVINVIENVYGIFDETGKLTHFRGFLFDVTYIKEVENDLIRAKERAEDADRLKTEFLAQMSHEIRSPLNAVLSFTGVLEELMSDVNSEDAGICFSGIASASKRIITTIDAILNMSDLQLGIYQVSKRDFNIVNLLQILVLEYKSIANNKNLDLRFSSDTDELTVCQDDYAFGQIMANLLDNALKYTKAGYVELKLETGNEIKISVMDTGIGISEEFVPNLFAPFSQEEQGYTRSYDGNGLGLALVKKYCDLLGAAISVQSKKNIGTTFTITL